MPPSIRVCNVLCLSARSSSSHVPDTVEYPAGQGELAICGVVAFERLTLERLKGHSGETSHIFTPAAGISPSVSLTSAISGNTVKDRQKTHAALDTNRTNTAGLLVGTPNTNRTSSQLIRKFWHCRWTYRLSPSAK